MPAFSIIVPIYNVEKYLKKCVDSILNQTCGDFELILVDDGSPDACSQICDAYAARDSRIRVIHKRNGGLVSARQAGANASTGRYILNVDGDDYVDPTFLEAIQRAVLEYEPDIVAFNLSAVSETGEEIRKISNKLPAGLYQGETLKDVHQTLLFNTKQRSMSVYSESLIYGVCAKAIRRELYIPLQNQVPKRIRYGEDTAVTVPAVYQCKSLLLIEEFGYRYRIHESSMINSFRKGEMQSLTELIRFLRENPVGISEESIIGYGYRQIEIHMISAARNIHPYPAFKEYIVQELLHPELMKIISDFNACNLKPAHRLRAYIIKKRAFWMIYLVYGR